MKNRDKDFRLMSIETVVDMLKESELEFQRMLIRERFAMNLDMERSKATASLFDKIRTPFKINDNRILRLLNGWARVDINFQEYELRTGDIILVKEDSYFEIKEVSEDARGEVMVFLPGKYQNKLSYSPQSVWILHPNKREWDEISNLFYTIYSLASTEPYRKDVVEPIIAALANNIMEISQTFEKSEGNTATELLFRRFIAELHDGEAGKHSVSYYAEKLCVSPQYLSRAVSQASGKSASEWINKAIIIKARILLQDRARTISGIADELGFPNDSFFCRFFKRETGYTPTSYRKSMLTIPSAKNTSPRYK